MSPKQEAEERAAWGLFRRLNRDPAYSYFRKRERPDFKNGSHGVELTRFIQDFYDKPEYGDHGCECRYQSFSKICNNLWKERYPDRPLPISVGYLPHAGIGDLKGRGAFNGACMKQCAAEFVSFAASVDRDVTLCDEHVAATGRLMAKYFQLVNVSPYKAKRSKQENWHYNRTPGWGYPQSGGGISVGSRIEEIIKGKSVVVSKYPPPLDRLDLLLYANAQTLASSLMPWAEVELQCQPIDPGPFSVVWLLDVPGRKLMRASVIAAT